MHALLGIKQLLSFRYVYLHKQERILIQIIPSNYLLMVNIAELIIQDIFQTERLRLNLLSNSDVAFVQELTNTKAWLKFIGDRGTATISGTENYIEKIEQNPNCKFWKVSLLENDLPIGLITLIKRDYLDDVDIGFAFLPQFCKKGYAFEGSKIVLDEIAQQSKVSGICGITNQENISSIKLLKKLGLTNHSTIKVEEEILDVYSVLINDLYQ